MLQEWFGLPDPFRELDRFTRDMEELFDLSLPINNIRGTVRGAFPAINVYEEPDAVWVAVFAPGMDPSEMDVTIEKNLLTVAAERQTSKELGDEIDPKGYHRRERFSGSFRRVVSLPESVDPEKVEARYSDGVLLITVGKQEAQRARKIEVAVS